MRAVFTLENLGAATGIAGALLMATMGSPALAFALFLASNIAWLCFAHGRAHWGLFAQQCLFLLTSLLGPRNRRLAPMRAAR